MKKLTGIAAIVILLFTSTMFGKAEAAVSQPTSCPKNGFQVVLKQKTDIKQTPATKSKTIGTLAKNRTYGVISRAGGWYKLCYKSKTAYIAASSTKEVFSGLDKLLVSKFKNRTNVKQVLSATNSKLSDKKVTIRAFEYVYGEWRRAFPQMKGVIGYNGFAVSKKEGDGKSPMGIYSFGTAFGTVTKPSGMAWTYRKSTTNDYWIDAPSSKYYNKWYTSARKPAVSHEKMYQPLYKYGAVINYNTSSIVKGKGSAIFLHIWRGSNSATAGCVATEEKNVVRILKWLNPKSDPRIVMGTVDYVKKMK